MAHINTAQIEISALVTSTKKATNDLSKIELCMQKYEVTNNIDWIGFAFRYISSALDVLEGMIPLAYKHKYYGNKLCKVKLEIERIDSSLQILYNDIHVTRIK